MRDIATGSLSQGGSTITQQVIKNTFLSRERTLGRKVREAILAIELERNYTKEKILEIYLNQIPYGSNAYGIEAASRVYFGKSAADLTLAEAALLAALPQAPSYYSPYGPHRDELIVRQHYALDRMVMMGSISEEEAQAARQAPLAFQKTSTPIRAPHFVLWIRELLEARYGALNVEEAGFRVISSLDWELQQKVEGIVRERALENEQKYKARNAAAVVIDPRQGEVLAMTGSRDYFDESVDGNVNVTLRPLQPGSAFKPFAYAAAFEKGYRPESIIYDAPTHFGGGYTPRNYDGRFRGPVTLRSGLAQSLNIPSVKTLYLAGVDETIDLAEDFGITTLKNRSAYGLALVLGSAEVKLFELARAYGVFATEGVFVPSRPILRIENARGDVLEEPRPAPRRVLDREVARMINDVLSDNEARTPTFGAQSALFTPGIPTAVKTGTTQNNELAWTVGYTPEVVVGVWAGNNNHRQEPISRQGAGVAAAGPMWNAIIHAVPRSSPPPAFTKPNLRQPIPKPMVGGYLGEPGHDILFYTHKDYPEDPRYSSPSYHDPQFALWEAGAARWSGSSATAAPPGAPASPTPPPGPEGAGAADSAAVPPAALPLLVP